MAARADALIERVLAASSVYDALGVARDATIYDVRKVYRKYCLRVHPDKCKVCASAFTAPETGHASSLTRAHASPLASLAQHPMATEAFQRLGSFVVELERLGECGYNSGDNNPPRSSWRERWQRYGEAPDIEWEEGSSCGSWGDESSDEEGYAPEPPPTRKKPAPCSPPPPPPPPKRPAYPPAREAAPAPARPPPPPPKPVAPEEEDSSQGEEAPEEEDEYDQDDAHAAEAAINNHATQFYSWPPPEQQAPPIWMLPPEAVPASARSALRQAVKVILAQHGREEALQLADAQKKQLARQRAAIGL